jgi:hypothetical protein
MPLVLVHNDVVRNPAHAWDDKEGVHYHYPSKYQGKIQTGERFVYYHGVHRVDGRRGPAEYVGAGRIGAIWLDPRTEGQSRKAWYCAVEDFRRFSVPVAAKLDGKLLEDIPANLWRDGVRSLAASTYTQIMSLAGEPASIASAPNPSRLVIATSDALVVPAAIVGSVGGGKGGDVTPISHPAITRVLG